MASIKMYDVRDFDYYNPKPFIKMLVDICVKSKDVQNRIAYDIDHNEYDYLFVYQNKEDEENQRKKTRLFHSDFVNLLKSEDINRVLQALRRAVDNYGENLNDRIQDCKRGISNLEDTITNAQSRINEKKQELKELEDAIAKYAVPSGTPEVPF
jgi:chromosome segregation ATPase